MPAPALRWERTGAMWAGVVGTVAVAAVLPADSAENGESDPHVYVVEGRIGRAATLADAKRDAAAAWARWCDDAGLVPETELRRVEADRDRLARRLRGARAVLDGAAVAAEPADPCGWTSR